MTKVKRKFTPEERLSILKEGEREGQTETIRKYNIVPSLNTRWKRKYTNEGFSGLQDKHKKFDPAIKALEEENERLKRIVAKQALSKSAILPALNQRNDYF